MTVACRRRTAGGGRSEAGYNLVILVVAITVLNIMVAAAIPLWRTAIRRDKEEELIFRGFQYAEAIRIFQLRFGRLPVRLEELVEVKPRCIRQLWADPITGKRDWVPVRVGMPGGFDPNAPNPLSPNPNAPPNSNAQTPGADGEQSTEDVVDAENPPSGIAGGAATPDGNVGLGPIRGVRSRSKEKSIKVLFNQSRYDKWEFTVELLAERGGAMKGFGVPGAVGLGMRLPTRWLGRPFRPGLTPNAAAPNLPPNPNNPPPNNPPPNNPPPPPPQGQSQDESQ
jgi:type II secretory pathway pseudopilin PulG